MNLGHKADFFQAQRWLFQPKHLDLLILASCSCLLTVLYQPVIESLSPAQAVTPLAESATSLAVSPFSSILEGHWVVLQKRHEQAEDSEAA